MPFFAQLTSRVVHYNIIYHPFPINSQYLKTREVDSPALWNPYLASVQIKTQTKAISFYIFRVFFVLN